MKKLSPLFRTLLLVGATAVFFGCGQQTMAPNNGDNAKHKKSAATKLLPPVWATIAITTASKNQTPPKMDHQSFIR